MDKKVSLAIVGATGLVGQELISILEERPLPIKEIRFLASDDSTGEKITFNQKSYTVQPLQNESFKDINITFFVAGLTVSQEYIPRATAQKCIVIDNSSVFRMEREVPLVVPEVNQEEIKNYKKRYIIANPNCSTIQLVQILKPIHDAVGIKRVVVSTYQSVSGAGKAAVQELSSQITALFNQQEITKTVFPHKIAFNCIPHIDNFEANGYTREEMKIINETKKILNDQELKITATAVRVPVFSSHSESVNIETKKKISVLKARELLAKTPGVKVEDTPPLNRYPLNEQATAKDETLVGRIREDFSIENGLNFWIVSDNLRKGAALNAVQIAERLIKLL